MELLSKQRCNSMNNYNVLHCPLPFFSTHQRCKWNLNIESLSVYFVNKIIKGSIKPNIIYLFIFFKKTNLSSIQKLDWFGDEIVPTSIIPKLYLCCFLHKKYFLTTRCVVTSGLARKLLCIAIHCWQPYPLGPYQYLQYLIKDSSAC